MKKRNLIALLMAVCMMFSLLPVNAIAVGDEEIIPAEETLLSENGNDPAAAGDDAPAKDEQQPAEGENPDKAEAPTEGETPAKDGQQPDKGEEPVEDEKQPVDEQQPAEGENSDKAEDPAEDEQPAESSETNVVPMNVVPMRVVRPDTDNKYLTYIFQVDGKEVSRQIVKKGDTLYQPNSPVKDGYKFTGWVVNGSKLTFGTVGDISETTDVTVNAAFTEVLYVFFADTNGRIVRTKEGVSGDKITTDDVSYGLENSTDAITGWYLERDYKTRVESVTLDKENITVYAKVEGGHWLSFDSSAGGTYVAPQFYSATAPTKDPAVTMERPGYTFDYWEYNGAKFNFGGTLAEDITLTAHWTPNTNTRYTLIYWIENADDEYYSFDKTVTATGTTGAEITLGQIRNTELVTADRAHFSYDETETLKELGTTTIEGDGSTVVNVYFARATYTLTFKDGNGTVATIKAKYNQNIAEKFNEAPFNTTYIGRAWKCTESSKYNYALQTLDRMPGFDATFNLYNMNSKTQKTIYYYVQNPGTTVSNSWPSSTTNFTLLKSVTTYFNYATYDEEYHEIQGYTRYSASTAGFSGNQKSFTNNTLTLYYKVNSYDLRFYNGDNATAEKTVSLHYTASLNGQDYIPARPTGVPDNYVFAGWYEDSACSGKQFDFANKKMPLGGLNLYAKWVPPEYNGTVYVDVAGTKVGKTLTIRYGETIDPTELDDLTLTYPDNDNVNWVFAGWTTDPDNRTPFNFNTKIYDHITLYPYFSNKSECTVTYINGTETGEDSRKYAVDAVADAMSIEALHFTAPEGKVFLGWAESENGAVKYQPNDEIKITGNIALYAIWGDKDVVVSLIYKANGGTGTDHVEEKIANNGLVDIWNGSSFSRTGYTLIGWSTDPKATSAEYGLTGSKARVDSNGDNILYAVWKANENTAYAVEFWYEQTNGTYTLGDTRYRAGTTDTTVSVTDADKGYGAPTYVYDEGNTNNLESGVVKADGSLTLKLYFKRNTAEYTIHHYLKGTEVKVAPDQTGTMTIGDTLTANASGALYTEYTSAHVNSYSPSQSLEMKATGNVITVYYTVPLTITAEDASRAYNGQPLTQPDFKVEGLVNGDKKTDITLSMTEESTITNVGSVPNVIDTDTVRFKGGELPGETYYEVPTYLPGTLTITADETEVVVTITGNHDSKVYNATEQSVTGYTTDVGTKTITVALKEGSKAEAKGKDVGKYYMGLSADDFTVTSSNYKNIKVVVNDGWLEITPITDEVTVTITGNHDSKVYNAAEQTVTGFTTDVGDKTIDVALNAGFTAEAKGTNVGKYYMHLTADAFSVSSDNYSNITVKVVDGYLEITPITDEVTVTITGNHDTKVYNAAEQSVTGYTTDVGNKTITVALKNGAKAEAKGTDVDTYYMGLTKESFSVTSKNYSNIKVNVVDGYLTITPITDEVIVTITGNNDSKVYNGGEQSVTGYTTDVGEKTITVALKDGVKAEAKGTDVNTYYMGLTKDSFSVTSRNYGNIKVIVNDGWLKITPRTEEIIITTPTRSRAYNGERLVDYQTTHTGTILDGDRLVVLFPADAGLTDAGSKKNEYASYYVERISTGEIITANYTFGESVIGTLTVTPVEIELTANSASKQYDGTPLTDSGYKITKGAFVTRNERIDGESVEVSEGLASVTVEGSQTLEGSSANKITGHELNGETKAQNYDIKYVDGTLTVSQNEKVITVTAKSRTWEYDGQPHSDGGYTVRYDGKDYTAEAGESVELPTGDILTATVEGTVTNVADSADDNNVVTAVTITDKAGNVVNDQFKTITIVPGTLTITRRGENPEKPVELIADNSTVPYDGEYHGYVGHTAVYLAEGHRVLSVKSDFTAKYVGFYEKKIDLYDAVIVDENGVDVTENYKITYKNGDLRIVSPGTVVVTIEGNTDSKIYNGKPQTVTGYKVISISNSAYTAADFSLADGVKAEATGTNVGKYYMGLTKDSFVNNNTQNFASVAFEVKDGWLEITPITDETVVTITGNTDTKVYNASEQKVTGYTTDVGSKTISVTLNTAGKDTAKGTNVGKYYMDLTKEDFTVTSENYSNIKVVVNDGWLEITPITDETVVTITGNTDTKVYNAAEQKVTGYTTDVGEKTITVTLNTAGKDTAKGTNVGKYYMGLTKADFTVTSENYSNIKVVVNDGWLEITPITDEVIVNITGNTATKVYNTTEQSVSGYTTDVGTKTISVKLNTTGKDTAKGTDVGKYYMGLTEADFTVTSENYSNIKVVVNDGWLEITPITDEVTVTISGNTATKVYNTTEQSVTGFTTDVGEKTITVALKDGHKAEAKGTNVGKYNMNLTADDFTVTSNNYSNIKVVVNDGWLEITPITDETVVTITGNTATKVYNASEQSVTGYTTDVGEKTITVTLNETGKDTAEGTDVGKYYMGLTEADFTVTSENYSNIKVVVNDGWLEITPYAEEVTVTITGSTATKVYNASEQSVTGYTTDVGTKTIDVKLNETGKDTATGINVGKYYMGLSKDDFTVTSENYSNIKVVVNDGWLEITPITDETVVTITGNTDTKVYNAAEQKVTGYTTDVGEKTITVTLNTAGKDTAKGTDVGKYYMGLTKEDFTVTSENYSNIKVVVNDGWLEITPITDETVVTITGNHASKVYSGKEQSVTGYTTDVGTKTISVTLNTAGKDTATGINVGKYYMGLTKEDFTVTSDNYKNIKVIVVDGYLDITPITDLVVVTITGNKDTKVYNGKEQSVTGYTTDVGTKTIDVKLNTAGKDTAKGTNAGTYYMGLTAADFTVSSSNYSNIKVIVKDGSLKITPITDRVTVTVTEKSASYVYNGTERSITGYKSMSADNGLYNVKTNVAETPTAKWTAKGTNTGKYPVGIKAGDFKNTSGNFTNVVFVIVDGALEITPVTSKVTVTVTEKSGTVIYDGKQHSITGYESMTADNALYDVTTSVKATKTAAWTAKGTEAGEYPVGIAAGDFKNTSSNFTNVEFVIVDGALTIEPDDAEVIVTITGNTKTVTYDGKEHSVEGYTVDVNGLPIKVTPKADLEAKASGTNAGTYYMGLTAADFTAESQNYSNIKIVVKDGWLKINPITATVTVTVVENKGTVEYDGKEHSVKGYVSMTSDHPLYDVANVAETPTAAWTAKGTDAGKYPVGIESGDFRNTSRNFANVEFKIVDGALTITRRGENPESPVTLRAKDSTVVFDGKYHGYVGQTATNLAEGHSVRSVKSDFTARNVGLYTDKIDLHDAVIVDANGRDVTRNYVLTYIPGTLEITPYEGEVLVTITGNNGVFRYDGMNHTVSGYTMEASVPFFTMDDIRFTGKAEITKARPGDYMMGLKTEDFSVANANFTNVKFTVIDGGMRIYTVRYTVAWMFDTDQMLTDDASNRYFSAMADYIDRSDISLVLHTGNVVADAKDQSQWDVYNNAMQPLYDDEDTDVLMIAAEKEAADGSLFLQQPVREDFKEEDLFENGKGFVRRFNIGEKSVILVGLGADALTEEGYKWAREKFDSDKDASGILMVNTYLLEDMTKDEKIDESALDIEKEIVKACSNVRMVLSSSGGYSSHYEFFYGERKVIAINSDIEAAAKAGYFTMLTFNEDLNILSVTNLCPYTYDFVYNERQAYKECYVLNDVL